MIPLDKQKHAIMGAAIALVFTVLADPFVGFTVAAVVGVLKEAWDDRSGRGVPDALDAIYTAGGGVVGALVAYALTS